MRSKVQTKKLLQHGKTSVGLECNFFSEKILDIKDGLMSIWGGGGRFITDQFAVVEGHHISNLKIGNLRELSAHNRKKQV